MTGSFSSMGGASTTMLLGKSADKLHHQKVQHAELRARRCQQGNRLPPQGFAVLAGNEPQQCHIAHIAHHDGQHCDELRRDAQQKGAHRGK